MSVDTRDVFLESAFFTPEAILGRARSVGLVTDAAQRFERGVDPAGQSRAIKRALALLLPIAGGSAGVIGVAESLAHLPQRAPVALRASQLKRLLGAELAAGRVTRALEGLGMQLTVTAAGWQATPPSYRFDISIEADLIEEVARIVGFDAIPETDARIPQRFGRLPGERASEATLLEALAARG